MHVAFAEAQGTPSQDVIAQAKAKIGWHRMNILPDQITLPKGGALTLNGIAQGFLRWTRHLPKVHFFDQYGECDITC